MNDEKYVRPDWDTYFMNIVKEIAKRGTCDRGRTGALLVRDNRILAAGYVGSPHSVPHCDDVGHDLIMRTDEDGTKSQHCIRTTHAELNAVAQAAKDGVHIDGATMYCKLEPCYTCAKVMVNAGVKRVVCEKRYQKGERTRKLFQEAGVALKVIFDEVEEYPDPDQTRVDEYTSH